MRRSIPLGYAAGRAADHGHDLRLLRGARRAQLNEVDGVTADVNYATERATVDYDPATVGPAQLVDAVEAVGYGALLRPGEHAEDEADLATAPLRRRVPSPRRVSLPSCCWR